MGPYSVKLQFSLTDPTTQTLYYKLRVDSLLAHGLANAIFVYRRTTAGTDIFEGIATPIQLANIPVTTPDPDGIYPNKLRKTFAEYFSQFPEDLTTAKETIEAAVLSLTNNLQKADDLAVTTTETIGVIGALHSTDSLLSY